MPFEIINRSVQIEILPKWIEVEYQLGFADQTLREEIQKLAPEEEIPEHIPAALEMYRDLVFPLLAEKMELRLDDRPVELLPVEGDLTQGHHTRLTCRYRLMRQTTEEPTQLEFFDRNFLGHRGSHRIALKGRLGVTLLESTTEIDLKRIHSQDLSTLSQEEQMAAHRVEATFRYDPVEFMPQSEPVNPYPAPQWLWPTIFAGLAIVGLVLIGLSFRPG